MGSKKIVRMLVAFVAVLAMLVGTIGAASAAPSTTEQLVVQVQSLNGNPLIVNMSAESSAGRTRGYVTLYDPQSRVMVVGTISVLTPIDFGFHYEGCGVAIGIHRGMVCFEGAAQAHPYGNETDFFSFVVTRGFPYTVYGQVTSGGVYYR
jgi:hypothetical protein